MRIKTVGIQRAEVGKSQHKLCGINGKKLETIGAVELGSAIRNNRNNQNRIVFEKFSRPILGWDAGNKWGLKVNP